jgi:hypothetical protein
MMDLVQKLLNKNIRVTELRAWGLYLRFQWESSFAERLSAAEKEGIYLHDSGGACGYLWHLFSWKKAECLEGDRADAAFSRAVKAGCYLFYQHSDEALLLEDAFALQACDLLEEEDVYITDRQFRWTYVRTHEAGLFGPYFHHLDNSPATIKFK